VRARAIAVIAAGGPHGTGTLAIGRAPLELARSSPIVLGAAALGASMLIRKYIPGATFDPETINMMIVAFNGVQLILSLDNLDDPLVEIVAKKVISLASQGMTDSGEIARRVIADTDPR
jgi:hypothetical protein